jgi:hypothetical protein
VPSTPYVNPLSEPTESIANDEKLMFEPADGVEPHTEEIDAAVPADESLKFASDKEAIDYVVGLSHEYIESPYSRDDIILSILIEGIL